MDGLAPLPVLPWFPHLDGLYPSETVSQSQSPFPLSCFWAPDFYYRNRKVMNALCCGATGRRKGALYVARLLKGLSAFLTKGLHILWALGFSVNEFHVRIFTNGELRSVAVKWD